MKILEVCSFSGRLTVSLNKDEHIRDDNILMKPLGYEMVTSFGLPILKSVSDGFVCWFDKIDE
jgi:hypothetical protein